MATFSEKPSRDWSIFFSSVFFVLGFSLVFSLVGVLLQTVLSNVSYSVQEWLGRIGGIIIILFGFFMLGLLTPAFLKRSHKIMVKQRFRSHSLTSFVFGAAFAVGWTPCVSVALGQETSLLPIFLRRCSYRTWCTGLYWDPFSRR
jgi:cytochrome c-type biogenesis protein